MPLFWRGLRRAASQISACWTAAGIAPGTNQRGSRPTTFSNLTRRFSATAMASPTMWSASRRASRRAASPPKSSPETAHKVESAQLKASFVHRAPRKFEVTRTGKARSSTPFAGITLAVVPSTAPRMNLPPPVITYSPYASELADQPITAPSVRFEPTRTAALSSGRPFCTQTSAPSGATVETVPSAR